MVADSFSLRHLWLVLLAASLALIQVEWGRHEPHAGKGRRTRDRCNYLRCFHRIPPRGLFSAAVKRAAQQVALEKMIHLTSNGFVFSLAASNFTFKFFPPKTCSSVRVSGRLERPCWNVLAAAGRSVNVMNGRKWFRLPRTALIYCSSISRKCVSIDRFNLRSNGLGRSPEEAGDTCERNKIIGSCNSSRESSPLVTCS